MSCERIEVKADPDVIAAWQSHFQEGVTADPNAMTADDLAKLAGISNRTMQTRLRAGLDIGTYVAEKAYRRDVCGRLQLVPVYKLVENKRGKRGRAKER